MKRLWFGTLMALGLGTSSFVTGVAWSASAADQDGATEQAREVEIEPGVDQLERVDSFTMLSRPHSWRAVDNDTVIVWATPFKPYLIELAHPSHDLRFAHVIGVTSVGSRVHAKFDSVHVRGLRYPISSIYKMTREEAKNWT
jgi:hypothetical protein